MNHTPQGPRSVAMLAWIAGEVSLALLSPRSLGSWRDVAAAAHAGAEGWQTLLTWGAGSRRLQADPANRQVFADGCGAAVLAVLLRTHGVDLTQTLLWNMTRLPTGGTTLHRMAEIASAFGVSCRVLRLPVGSRGAPFHAPCVLHLRRAHFVLLQRTSPTHALLLDPALGLVRVPWRSLLPRTSGLVLTCDVPRPRRAGGSSRVGPGREQP